MSDELRGDNLIIFQSYPLECLRWFVLCSFVQPDQETEMRLYSDVATIDPFQLIFSHSNAFLAPLFVSIPRQAQVQV